MSIEMPTAISFSLYYYFLAYLPGRETQCTHQMSAGFDFDIFVILGADLAKLESGSHFTVQLILLLLRHIQTPLFIGSLCFSLHA